VLNDRQARQAVTAAHDAPNGFLVVARKCRAYGNAKGNTGAGLLMYLLGRGEHFAIELQMLDDAAPEPVKKKTGKRFVRGTHWHGLIDDPDGTD
jgi:hypothetical protein